MKQITVYCAFCHRPLAGQRLGLRQATDTCRRQPVFKRKFLGYFHVEGTRIPYWAWTNSDGVMECTVEVQS
jgi:hypothetical protein